jgi:hypothetical protein
VDARSTRTASNDRKTWATWLELIALAIILVAVAAASLLGAVLDGATIDQPERTPDGPPFLGHRAPCAAKGTTDEDVSADAGAPSSRYAR